MVIGQQQDVLDLIAALTTKDATLQDDDRKTSAAATE
jgi:hypothetical protein